MSRRPDETSRGCNWRAAGTLQRSNKRGTNAAPASGAAPQQQLTVGAERPPDGREAGAVSFNTVQREDASGKAHLPRPAVRDHMDGCEAIRPRQRPRHLRGRRACGIQPNRGHFGPQACNQRLYVADRGVDKRNLPNTALYIGHAITL